MMFQKVSTPYIFSATVRLASVPNVTWNYQKTGHSKGAPDGIGGVYKRTADRIMAQGSDLPDMDTLLNVLQENYRCGHYEIGTLIYPENSPTSGPDTDEELGMIYSRCSSRIRYEEVYNDTETLCTDTTKNGFPTITTGMYVLAEAFRVHTKTKKHRSNNNRYIYAALCQSSVDEYGEIKVVFLNVASKNDHVFLIDDSDISYINKEKIVNVVPQPSLVVKGNLLYNEFPSFVEVCERR
ncbi:hypothetical protein PR048_014592 [Dryococelus australis]|uniref:Uncharacterized protein n=1 Tax=Dryococelus australis TaxID=614101 RepID=A0ABQ9HEN4_9NEOP|nr:hypothetical protein PR048_014592 [Dryococelus australis]